MLATQAPFLLCSVPILVNTHGCRSRVIENSMCGVEREVDTRRERRGWWGWGVEDGGVDTAEDVVICEKVGDRGGGGGEAGTGGAGV